LALYQHLIVAAYGVMVISIAVGWLPVFSVLAVATGLPVYKLTRGFTSNPDKKETFINAVKSFVMIAAGMVISMGMAVAYAYYI